MYYVYNKGHFSCKCISLLQIKIMKEILINYLERSSNVGTVFLGLCLLVLTMTIINQMKKKKLVIKKNSKEQTLDDYSLRDLFHFFVNEEYHADKFHLAKGFSNQIFFDYI